MCQYISYYNIFQPKKWNFQILRIMSFAYVCISTATAFAYHFEGCKFQVMTVLHTLISNSDMRQFHYNNYTKINCSRNHLTGSQQQYSEGIRQKKGTVQLSQSHDS